jgi:hypothetical protein
MDEEVDMSTLDERAQDTQELQEMLGGIQLRLRRLVELDRLEELVPIWKRPGWTTPAELFLVGEALKSIDAQVSQIERNVDVLIRGADMVGG